MSYCNSYVKKYCIVGSASFVCFDINQYGKGLLFKYASSYQEAVLNFGKSSQFSLKGMCIFLHFLNQ